MNIFRSKIILEEEKKSAILNAQWGGTAMKIQKTNAMRILDSKQLSYEVLSYAHGKEAVAGLDVAKQLEENPEQVFKTLVTVANTKEYIVFVIPVAHELHLKKCAKAAGVKSVEMIHVKDINKITGYVRGGCSPSV